MSDRTLWGVGDDAERLHEDQGEAVGAYVEDEGPDAPKPGEPVVLHEYRPLKLPESWKAVPGTLDDLYLRLGVYYGDEDDTSPEPTEAVCEAMNALWATIRRDYRVWRCAPTGRKVVLNFHEWCMENAPEIFDGHCIHCGDPIERPGGQACPGRDDPGGPCETHPSLLETRIAELERTHVSKARVRGCLRDWLDDVTYLSICKELGIDLEDDHEETEDAGAAPG